MLDIKFIKENKDLIIKNCQNRGVEIDMSKLLESDEKRRSLLKDIEERRATRNRGSKIKPSEEEIIKMKELGNEVVSLENELAKINGEYEELLKQVPNLTHPEVPIGGEEDYKILYEKKPKEFNFRPKDHEELMLDLNLIDFERAAKVTESKFYYAKNNLVRLDQALISYGIDILSKEGFTLMETPDLAKNSILEGIGFNPRGEETQVYSIEDSDLSLIGTAEITLGGYHANEILELSKGPIKYAGLSHCFRTEAGAYGRTSRGLYRVHQFSKLEMFVFCKPEESDKMHEELLRIEKKIVSELRLPYRVIDIASRDLGASAYRKFDIEAWMTMKNKEDGQGNYGEITSTSNTTNYQARRLGIKYRKEDGSTDFVHTLNGTAIALSRFPIAIVENYQTKKGTIEVPKILRKYMGGIKEIKR